MEQYIHFFSEHWVLSGAFVFLIVAFIANEIKGSFTGGILSLNPQELVQLMNHKNAVIVDIRTPEQFKEGHVLGSLNIPLTMLDKKIATLNKHKAKPVVIICTHGRDASQAGKKLQHNGFSDVALLSGGLTAWNALGMPLSK